MPSVTGRSDIQISEVLHFFFFYDMAHWVILHTYGLLSTQTEKGLRSLVEDSAIHFAEFTIIVKISRFHCRHQPLQTYQLPAEIWTIRGALELHSLYHQERSLIKRGMRWLILQ